MAITHPTRDKPTRKWIDRRIAELDPEVDYVEIVRLTTLYRANAMQMDWFYTVGTPAAGISPAVNDAVLRNGTGKFLTQSVKRRDDSVDHLLLWFEHGPDAAATKKSISMVNKYHAHFARDYPTGFSDPEDYIYILCLNATLVHIASTSLGLRGFTPKQQRAAYLFWSDITDQFTTPAGQSVTELAQFPASFADMVAYVHDYQHRPWPVHAPSRDGTLAGADRFAATWFPRPLQFFGRALITAFFPDDLRRAHDVPAPPKPVAWAARRFMKTMMQLSDSVLSDPVETYLDKRRRKSLTGAPASAVDTAVHRSIGPAAAGCPHLSAARP
ncbi:MULTISPECIES: oxygenase MpaB family protein [Mycobacteriales]|uniref:Oxygenase MpaB family protein n=2 Tax=Gordonia rubripertincta TaxID=36822 RepID=A0AAW6RBC3_GORRU|nr:oxygenase MpaB family protein [Gordonia rubripertincta]ASR03037.1 hypothetical protein GCWB2_11200 [Gordonia rubripertincta]MDG6783233.1 oxygenase MpaB family protein [Gordonia rubripertincta]NKY62984.1 DUF2236 domain-containing protein [Gordonia rubripertincta]GAB87141.1 hypothetical protein GORBP_095_00120 [Gordonia rubripertincta NBRC 101908]